MVRSTSAVLHAGAISFVSPVRHCDNPLIENKKNSGTGHAEGVAFSFPLTLEKGNPL
jgi:hypothetical protein